MSDAMKRLSAMAKVLGSTKAKIAKLQLDLAALSANESRIETEDLPELMRELEMKSFKLKDGTEIEVVEDLKCGITVENRDGAHAWLRDNNFGGIIKTTLAQTYGVGEHDVAEKNAAAILKLTGRAAEVVESVHAGTLKSFLKEQRKKGTKIPTKLFGLFPFSKAKVTPPKS